MDFISCLPSIVSKAAPTSKTDVDGFVNIGMLDEQTKCYPDIYRIMKTVRRNLGDSEVELVEDNFKYLFEFQLDHGHISDDVYQTLGFPPDKDVEGNIYDRNAGISQESCQRAKCVSRPMQRSLRKERI